MNREFVLGAIATLMGWNDEQARREFAWLRLMSRMKYDDYQEFLAGMRFIESLADWLQQFDQSERANAYEFIRSRLVFLSEAEMRHLAELLYPETIEPLLLARAAEAAGVSRYRVWSDPNATEVYERFLRQTVFIELSDGARGDVFRRSNEGRVSNEQIVTAPRINKAKWDDMLGDLRSDLSDDDAKSAFAVLIDDFSGSGKSLIRHQDKWKGKLQRFWEDVNEEGVIQTHFTDDWTLVVHHYVATTQAVAAVTEQNNERAAETDADGWFERIQFTWGMVLAPELKLTPTSAPEFAPLAEKYYDDAIESRHTQVGGDDLRWGFGSCGLPLVLEHNAPNNSVALLWAESAGANEKHTMRPLFRRRQRHV
jgi:hypothetical protein